MLFVFVPILELCWGEDVGRVNVLISQGFAGGFHGFTPHGAGDGCVHLLFGEIACGVVEGGGGGADGSQVACGFCGRQMGACGLDLGFFVFGDECPGGAGFGFFERGEDGVGFEPGFDDLAGFEVGLGVVEGFEDHGLDLLVGEAVGGLDFDLGFLTAALFAG